MLVLGGAGVSLVAQIPGRNVNMVAGTEWPGGDPFLQRQNEPSIAASTRNPLHLLAGSNDYRTVDLPGLPDGEETGDAWVSVYKSFDGGSRWSSTLMPGYPQDTSTAGLASPLKGYQAAADPVVRAGTNGLIYYNGLVFDRGEGGKSGIFLTRFIDRNNKENGDPVAFLGTSMVASSNGTVFLDKPWMVVDMPRNNAPFCVVGGVPTGARVKRAGHRLRGNSGQTGNAGFVWVDPGLQYVPAGAIYVAYTSITGEDATLRAEILLKRSLDCGATWSAPMRVSRSTDAINQGATLAIDPADGDLFVAYRRFATPQSPTADAVMVARLPVGQMAFGPAGMARALPRTDAPTAALERIFEHRKKRAQSAPAPVTATSGQIDQGTSPFSFRTNAYPTMAIDGQSRVYVAWSERGFGVARPGAADGDARIRMATTLDGATFSGPVTVEDPRNPETAVPLPGHQLMPSLTFAGGKLLLVYYDLRETRAGLFGPFVSDQPSLLPLNKRQTIDIRASLGSPGPSPTFAPSVRVSDYIEGFRNGTSVKEPLQVNPPNLPMFKLGTVPFIGDYIDVSPSPAFVPTAGGGWAFNTAPGAEFPVFHAVWTDNRDVRPPLDGNWANYTPPTIDGQFPATSLFDPSQQVAVCQAGNAGSRNQNIYTARISGGLLVGSPGNTKPLSPTVQRGFVVFAQNQTTGPKTFRMTILAQPPGGRASFEQFPRPPYSTTAPPPPPLINVDLRVPARSTASRTVYATSTDPKAQLSIDVKEITAVGGVVVTSGLAGRTVLNPDIENPDIENPDIENPDIENPDIENAEVYNPDIENPDIENPDIENPDIENPDIENPDIENVVVANPDIENIGIATPDIENPDIENPDIENPGIKNPDIENGTISDVSWTVSNIGNTTSAFNVNVFLASAGLPPSCSPTRVAGCIDAQLIVYKTYKTPVLAPNGCDLRSETRNVVLYNVANPNFITPGEGLPDQNDSSETNATLWLNPGEVGRVTLRIYDGDTSDNVVVTNPDGSTASIDPRFNPTTVTTVGVSGQGVDVLDPFGATEPPAVTTTGTNLFFLQQPSTVAPATLMAPPVRVRIWDNTGAPLSGVAVNLALCGPQSPLLPTVACPALPAGVTLSGTTTAVADAAGIATFSTLAVSQPAAGLTLRATAASAGVVAAGTSAPFDVTLTGGPVSLWRADANTLDSVGSNDGTLQGGAGYALGRIGPGFSFSNPLPAGTRDQYVLVPDDPSLRITNQLTMSAWIRPAGPGTGPAPQGVGEGGIIINKEWAYEMARFADGSIRWAFGNGVDSFAPLPYWVDSGGVAPLGAWTHVAVTYSNGTVTTYINGVQVSSISPPGIVLGAGTSSLRIGGRELYPGEANFDGLIDEVGIQNRALTPTEVLALYNAALPQAGVGVSITNVNAIWDGSAKPVTVTTTPSVSALTLYNSSTTVPSAIGAYSVQAIVNQNGYAGAASALHKIASTLPAGGNGGGPYERYCGPGQFANGVRPSTNSYYGLAGAQLLCTDLNHPARFVGTPPGTYTETDVTCAPGEVMVGLHGQAGPAFGDPNFVVVANMGPRCQAVGGGITDVPAAGGGNQVFPPLPFSLTCQPGQAVTGVVGGIGEVVDSIALACGPASAASVFVPGTAGGTANANFPSPGGTAPVSVGVLSAGQSVALTATGQVQRGASFSPLGPDGEPTTCAPTFASCLANNQRIQALIARVGGGPWQFIGAGPTIVTAPIGGVLELAVNDDSYSDNSGGFVVAVGPPVLAGTITSISPSTGSNGGPGSGLVVVRGTGLPAVAGTTAVVSNGATAAYGFVFQSPSSPGVYWVRLPGGFPLGPATMRIQNGANESNAFPITVSATHGTPVVTGVRTYPGFAPTTSAVPGSEIAISADGVDTLGWEVRFTQGAGTWIVTPDPQNFAVSNGTIGVALKVFVPAGPVPGEVDVSIRQAGSAFSTPVTLVVP